MVGLSVEESEGWGVVVGVAQLKRLMVVESGVGLAPLKRVAAVVGGWTGSVEE